MKKIVTIVAVVMLSIAGVSQTSSALSLRVNLKPVSASGERLAGDDVEAHPTSAAYSDVSLIVEIPSETETASIRVQLNHADGSSIVAHDFIFDQTTGLPSGFSFQRNGKRVILGLGNYAGVSHYTASVILVDASGVESEALIVSK